MCYDQSEPGVSGRSGGGDGGGGARGGGMRGGGEDGIGGGHARGPASEAAGSVPDGDGDGTRQSGRTGLGW